MFLRNSWYVAAWDREVSRNLLGRMLPGEPAKADPALIPNGWWADHKEWAFTRPDRVHLKCNYQLIADHVLDVTQDPA